MQTSSSSSDKARPQDLKVDVAIVGGGMVGLSLAHALADAGLRTAVLDRAAPRVIQHEGHDGRGSAIAHASKNVLEAIGVWRHVGSEKGVIDRIRVSDQESSLFLDYSFRDVGDHPLGYIVENTILRRALFARLKETEAEGNGPQLLAPAVVSNIDREPGRVRLDLEDGRQISASLVVGAEGRVSPTRESARIRVSRWSYHQSGIVCTVALERPHNNVAHERFLPPGPFALLPLKGDFSSVVWTERQDRVPRMMALSDADFSAEMTRRFGDSQGALTLASRRWAYPLSLQHAERYTDHRLVLVGDAAHGMHPLAGQGLNMGIRDVAALTDVLVNAARLGLDIGRIDTLKEYERWRRFDNLLMLAVTDNLNRLFSNDILPIKLARDIGMAIVNRIAPLKRVLIRDAMGSLGELPRLMQDR